MINHKNNFVWVNTYPLEGNDLNQITDFLKACVKERCEIEGEEFKEDRVVIKHALPYEVSFEMPKGDITGVYWWEYRD